MVYVKLVEKYKFQERKKNKFWIRENIRLMRDYIENVKVVK